jgi:hypothetical protein
MAAKGHSSARPSRSGRSYKTITKNPDKAKKGRGKGRILAGRGKASSRRV